MAYAHSRNHLGQRQDLSAHLEAVARITAENAAYLDASDLGRFIGLVHDAGKHSDSFAQYLLESETAGRARRHGPDHKAAGSLMASKRAGLAAMLVKAHHGGLDSPNAFRDWLASKQGAPEVPQATERAQLAHPELRGSTRLAVPPHARRDPLAAELFLRLLFSALVDADFLDTERHFDPERSSTRSNETSMQDLWSRFATYHDSLPKSRSAAVAAARDSVYQACLEAADQPPGLFRLTVPTGGGKTLSGMAFALRHAIKHGQRRIIVAVPFISITEQTADVYRAALGDETDGSPIVLEHHSGVYPDEVNEYDPVQLWRRLSAENWDAPVVVTTTVQLMDSLFASSTSRCRKLHRLAGSVILLDEAQALPSHLLEPILDVLKALCVHYGTTVVLSTATQPAFETIPTFSHLPASEIVPEPGRFFQMLRRVEYCWKTDEPVSWEEVAEEMAGERQTLAIVNTRRDALALLDALGDPEALHLSTLLCGAHRRAVLRKVNQRLKEGLPCRLVSTQVVEAGVDLDFPLVLRALGPLDGIIQAAGRCNREGLLEKGRVVVFRPRDGGLARGAYRTGVGITESLLEAGKADPDDPALARRYFQSLFQAVNTDREGIQVLRSRLDYPEVARRFRMIEEDTESVVVTRYGTIEQQEEVRMLLDGLSTNRPSGRDAMRRLQPYIVAIRRRQAEEYRRRGLIAVASSGVGEWLGGYDPIRGLTAEDFDPGDLVL